MFWRSNKEKSVVQVLIEAEKRRSNCPILKLYDRIEKEQKIICLEEKLATNRERHAYYKCEAFVDKIDNCDRCGNIGIFRSSRPRDNLDDLYRQVEALEKEQKDA